MPFVAGAVGITLLQLAYGSLTWKTFVAAIRVCPQLFCDFVDYYYPMGKAIFHTGLPVEGFLYSPFTAMLLAAFPLLGPDLSIVLWGILQVTVVILYVLMFYRLVPARLPIQLFFVALTLFSYPLWLNFLGGNTCMFITAALVGLLMMIERGRYTAAAVLLAIAVSFKFYPIIFLGPIIAGRNARFALLATATCVAVLVLIPGMVLGVGRTLDFYRVLLSSFRASDWVTANPYSQFFPHVVLRLAGVTGAEAPVTLLVLRVISYCVAALNLIFVYLVQRTRVARANFWSFQIVFLTTPFVLKTSWPADFTFLPFVQAFLVWHVMERGTGPDSEGGRVIYGRTRMMLFLILSSTILSSVFFHNLLGNSSLYGFCGFAFLANILLLIVIYTELLPVLRRSRGEKGATAATRGAYGSGASGSGSVFLACEPIAGRSACAVTSSFMASAARWMRGLCGGCCMGSPACPQLRTGGGGDSGGGRAIELFGVACVCAGQCREAAFLVDASRPTRRPLWPWCFVRSYREGTAYFQGAWYTAIGRKHTQAALLLGEARCLRGKPLL